MKTLILLSLFLLLLSCNKGDDVVPFTIEGKWVGTNWHCDNPSICLVKPDDKGATLTFSITKQGDQLQATEGNWSLPSCEANPSCGTSPWVVSFVSFSNPGLKITWEHGYEFEGSLANGVFKGTLYQVQSARVVWNASVELKKAI